MLNGRRLTLAVVPLVILLWTTFVVLGGAMYVSEHADVDQGQAVKTGLGLCAATVALLSSGITRVPSPPAPAKVAPHTRRSPSKSRCHAPARADRRLPDLATPPLLQVFRI